MKIGDRFYASFEIQIDREAATTDLPFIADLQSARVGAATVDVAALPVIAIAPPAIGAAASGDPATSPARVVHVPSPTPLELAVQELLAQLPAEPAEPTDIELSVHDLVDDSEPTDGETVVVDVPPVHVTHDPAPAPTHAPTAKPTATLAVREPAPLPDNPNPSHVHLVMEDGAERVVVTVAVRGNEVNVGLRASDGEVAAALARNAATLDHAMRARGLDLASFSAERDRSHDHEEREHEPSHEQETA